LAGGAYRTRQSKSISDDFEMRIKVNNERIHLDRPACRIKKEALTMRAKSDAPAPQPDERC